jgi:hypothetical protein
MKKYLKMPYNKCLKRTPNTYRGLPEITNTMRTAGSRISGKYLFDLFITPSSQEMEPPTNSERFTDTYQLVKVKAV